MASISDLDPCMDRLLSNVECSPRYDIVEQIIMDHDEDIIDEARTHLFDLVKKYLSTVCEDRYGPLSARGEDQIEDICIKRRAGEKKMISKANDIYDMYVYLRGLTDSFPRSVLGSTSRVPDGL
ncbi:unnamed protein product, partial [Owenia fusiformis]